VPRTSYDHLYRTGGFGYEAQRDNWREWVADHYIHEFHLMPGRLLDAGCGDGFWSSLFADAGFETVGVDISEGAIAVAREKYPDLAFRIGDVEQVLPFPEGSFDVILARGLSHLAAEDLTAARPVGAVRNLLRYAKPADGLLLLSTYSDRSGGARGSWRDHRVSDLARLAEAAGGDIAKVAVAGNYVQIGVRTPPTT
jgi:SAM-dependent methyltransferase